MCSSDPANPMRAARNKAKRSSRSRRAFTASRSRTRSGPVAATPPDAPLAGVAAAHWTFLTNHAHVLVLLSQNPSVVLREVALRVGITERAVQRIIADLEAAGFIEREKFGRQNRYRIRANQPLRHPNQSHHTIGELLALLNRPRRAVR